MLLIYGIYLALIISLMHTRQLGGYVFYGKNPTPGLQPGNRTAH